MRRELTRRQHEALDVLVESDRLLQESHASYLANVRLREEAIAQARAQGVTTTDIARALGITRNAVYKVRHRIERVHA